MFRELKVGGVTDLFKSESQCPAGCVRDSSPGGGTRVKAGNVLAGHPRPGPAHPKSAGASGHENPGATRAW